MTQIATRIAVASGQHPGRAALLRRAFAPACVASELVAVLVAAFLTWTTWRYLAGGQPGQLELHLRLGLGAGILAVAFTAIRGGYRADSVMADENTASRTAQAWNLAILVLFVVAFATRRTEDLSRGAAVLFYAAGFLALWATRLAAGRLLRLASKLRLVIAQRILVVGTPAGIAGFGNRYQPWNFGLELIGSVAIAPASPHEADGPARLAGELGRAVEMARNLAPDDVYLALPWSETAAIEACLDAFLTLPATIHLAPERILDRFSHLSIARVGTMSTLELTRPMPSLATFAKRVVDVVGAAVAIVLLLPVLVAIALVLKLDSRGPVLFRQTRYGFNQQPFRIAKFRTMTTFEDGPDVPQARAADARVTRVGRILRRTNLDELPQLMNVLAGHMSLVGPRPHAVPHNRTFERRIALYARRHNVRPGITGWAQVNGLRGETDTDDKMRRRVEYDLFYIDNWSLLFDLRILLRTLFSPKAYRNAY